MHDCPFGKHRFNCSEIGFGAWTIGGTWGRAVHADAMAALHRALDLGANFFDTAASYDNGKSEKLTGQHLNNARVIAKGTDRTAFADQTGAFVLGFVQE